MTYKLNIDKRTNAVAVDEWLANDPNRRLHAVKENLLLHKEAKSDVKFMWNIHLSVAKKYSDNLREEAMKGWAEKLAQGWLPSSPPPGYVTVAINGKRIHQPDPKTSFLIRRAFEKYLGPGESISTVVRYMKQMGLTTSKGRPYGKTAVHRMLENPFYIGINRFDGKDYPGAQESIIPKAVFQRVQQKMGRKITGRYQKHNPLFKNVIICSTCGRMVTWQLQKGRYYGACPRKEMGCKKTALLREHDLEAQIQQMLKHLVCPAEQVIDWVAQAMLDKQKDALESNRQLIDSLYSQIERITRMDSNLYDDKLSGEISAETYKQKHEEFSVHKAELEERLAQVDQKVEQVIRQKVLLLKLSQKAANIYMKKSTNQKRLIISKLFKQIIYKEGVLSVNYTNFAQVIANNVLETHRIIGGQK